MEAYKSEFIEFMVESDVLKFGDFTLKSGRKSPFFMNAGAYVTGEQLKRLGEYYARAIHDNFGLDFDVVFGPAYKGIPLSVVTAIALSELYGKEVRYCSDRKEVKDHGADKGNLLGYEPQDGDRVVMVEDVTTSGKSIDETYPKLHELLRPLSQDDIDDAIRTWNGDIQSKQAVIRYMGAHAREKDTAAWLAHEYSGRDSKSLFVIRAGSPEGIELPWPKVQRLIARLIKEDRFLTEQDRQSEPQSQEKRPYLSLIHISEPTRP